MSTPEEIRADIERTRADLGHDVDALAEKVDPAKAAGRQTDKVKDRFSSIRESVMGAVDHTSSSGQDTAAQARDQASALASEAGHVAKQAPTQIRNRTRGNPLAAGLIALGAGWLLGSLLPASDAEKNAATTVKDGAEPLVDEVKGVAQDMTGSLKPQAQDAAESLKDTASAAAETVTSEGKHHASELKQNSQQAAQNVKDHAQDS